MTFTAIKHWAGLSLATSTLVTLSACHSLAPDYTVPADTTPAQFKELNLAPVAGWKTAQPADQFPRGQWWQAFADPALDDLETRALGANQGLKQAMARLQESRAYYQGVESRRLPSLSAGIGPSRELDSQSSTNSPQPATTYWRAQMNFGDRLAVLGERAALWLPAPLVLFLFRRRHLRPRLGAS